MIGDEENEKEKVWEKGEEIGMEEEIKIEKIVQKKVEKKEILEKFEKMNSKRVKNVVEMKEKM